MTIKAVIGKIELAPDEPFCPGIFPLEYFVPLFEPVQLGRDAAPKLLRLLSGFAIETLVVLLTFDV